MKKLALLTILALTAAGNLLAQETVGKKDTIIISFGNGSRLILLLGNQDDLELIKRYDINAMISDLTHQISGVHDDNEITITDESGEKYLKKDPIIEERSEFKSLEDEDDSSLNEDREEDSDYDEDRDNDNDNDRSYRSKHHWPRTRQSINIDLGLNNYLENFKFPDDSNAPYALKQQKSWYVGINTTYKTNIAGPLFIEWGGGFDWYNFRLDNKSIRFVKTDSIVRFDPDPRTTISPIRSRLSAGYIFIKAIRTTIITI